MCEVVAVATAQEQRLVTEQEKDRVAEGDRKQEERARGGSVEQGA